MKSNFDKDRRYFFALGYTKLQSNVLARIVSEYYRGTWSIDQLPRIVMHHVNNQRLLGN